MDVMEFAVFERIAVALEGLAGKRPVEPSLDTHVCGRSIRSWLELERKFYELQAEVRRLAEEQDAS